MESLSRLHNVVLFDCSGNVGQGETGGPLSFSLLSKVAKSRLQVTGIWTTVAAAGTYLFLFDPANGTGYLPCLFHQVTGLDCPGCGTLRALHQLLHGHPLAAFKLNPLAVLSLPFLVCALLFYTRSTIAGRPLPRVFIPSRYIWLLLILILGFWVFRNTPYYPLSS